MNTASKIDPSTLGWVKAEIDETLKQARLALEAFAENPKDNGQLRFCVTYLHQVLGTLQMVELDGAALLARETEALAEAVLNEKVPAEQGAFELLTRGILTLPDYLARLQFGQADTPLRLLPLVNELRAAYRGVPLSELELFHPDLGVRPPRGGDKRTLSDDQYRTEIKRVRTQFQATLLRWLKDTENKSELAAMAVLLAELERLTQLGVIEQLLWVSGGLLAALVAGDLEPTPARKKLLAGLEQQIKRLSDGSERTVVRNTAESLIKSILFQLASANSRNEKVVELKRAFDLDALMGTVTSDDGDTGDLPTPEVLQSVAQALGKEIETAQELLSAYFDSGREDVATLAPLVGLLEKMSSTLAMIGVQLLKGLVDELLETARAITDARLPADERVSMQMAGALLLIENGAREFRVSGPGWKRQIDERIGALRALRGEDGAEPDVAGIEISDATLTEAEFKQLLKVVAAEIRVNLAKVEEALEAFAAHPADVTHIAHTAGFLSQIQGALQILGQARAAELTAITHRYIEQIQNQALVPDHTTFDALAIAVGTIEVYLEGLERDRPNLEALIDAAVRELDEAIGSRVGEPQRPRMPVDTLSAHIAAWLESPSDEVLSGAQAALADILARAETHGLDNVAHIAGEMQNLLAIMQDDPAQLSAEVRDTLTTSVGILAGLAREHVNAFLPRADGAGVSPQADTGSTLKSAPTAATAAAPMTAAQSAGLGDDLDEEIMQIFIEDATEVNQGIHTALGAWETNPEDQDALAELRRGFHTLKGSGRMVGASEIAELAWSVEHMLNQVREGKRTHAPEIFALLHDVKAVLPPLIEQLQGKPIPDLDIAALRTRASTLAAERDAPGAASAASEDLRVPTADPALRLDQDWAPDVAVPATAPEAEAFAADAAPMGEVSADEMSVNEIPADEMPVLEPTLLQIFTQEASGHVNTVREFAAAGPGSLVTHNLLRAAHTLQGNARSLGLTPMARACSEMEKFLQNLELRQAAVERGGVELLANVGACVAALLDQLNTGAPVDAERTREFARLGDAFAALTEELNREPAPTGDSDADMAIGIDASDTSSPIWRDDEPAPEIEFSAAPEIPASVQPVAASSVAIPATTIPVIHEEIVEEIDPELLEIFHEEAVDILENVEEALTQWRGSPADTGAVHSLKRSLHTLKGGARMAGAMTLGNLSHNTESLLKLVEDKKMAPNTELFDLLDEVHDGLAAMLGQLERREPIGGEALALNDKVLAWLGIKPHVPTPPPAVPTAAPQPTAYAAVPYDSVASENALPAGANEAAAMHQAPAVNEFSAQTDWAATSASESAAPMAAPTDGDDEPEEESLGERRERREHIKVRTRLLNDLVNYAGEVSISRSRMEQQIFGLREHLSELNGNVTRFREQIRELEIQSESQILYRAESGAAAHADFDPLEFDRFSRLQQVSRGLAESVHDLSTLQSNLDNFVGEAETVLQQQARVNTDLQEGLMRTRMINFSTQAARLRHIVRQTAREVGKKAELHISGTEVEVDRTVLERMIGPFEHMIRNALDHGIEDEAARRRQNKPAIGRVAIQTSHEGSEIVIRFSDDGGGLNVAAIRKKALERGLVKPNVNLSDEEVMQFILLPGFSTAAKVTHLSGRGVGMDVVHSEVKQLGGSITVDTQAGVGTTFIVRLPLTLSIAQALMVFAGDQLFAIPLSSIVNILEVPVERLNQISMGDKALLQHEDQVYPFMHLGARLGIAGTPNTGRKVPVLVARSGNRQIAVQIDGLAGTREVVIKSLGPQLTEIKGLAGATILGDGKVVLILDIAGLWITDDGLHLMRAQEQAAVAEPEQRERPLVMVVDDSLTVRKVTSRHLQKRGMEVLIAKDGLDAWEQLREQTPDVMLVDIEMPRMDGYELTANIRSDARLRHIPIIMITSRAGTKHRDRAMQLGVNLYMSKPYQEEELMRNIDAMLATATTA